MRKPRCTHYQGQCDRLVCDRELELAPGAKVRLRGMAGLGIGTIVDVHTRNPQEKAIKYRVRLQGLDEGRAYEYVDFFAAHEISRA